MSDSFASRTCEHCGRDIESPGTLREVGNNSVHTYCVDAFVNVTPKIELAPYTCDACKTSYYTEKGLERHECVGVEA